MDGIFNMMNEYLFFKLHQIIVSNCLHNSKRDNGETDPRHSIVDRVLLFAFDVSQELNCLEYVLSLQRNIT